VLETTSAEAMRLRETHWIQFFRPLGTLLNQSDGDGMLGMKHPLPRSVYERAAKTRTGRPMSQVQKENWIRAGGQTKFKAGGKMWCDSVSKAICSEDGLWMFKSIREAASTIGAHPSNLGHSIKLGWKCRGTPWRYCAFDPAHENPSSTLGARPFRKQTARITEEDKKRIHAMSVEGVTQTEIARCFGCDQSHVSRIINNQRKNSQCQA
jgi:hypothetical protein